MSREARVIRVSSLSNRLDDFLVGPETVDGVTYEVKKSDVKNTIDSIMKSDDDVKDIRSFLKAEIKAAVRGSERPIDNRELWRVIKNHTPDDIWPSYYYFGPPVSITIKWNIGMGDLDIYELLSEGNIVLDFK